VKVKEALLKRGGMVLLALSLVLLVLPGAEAEVKSVAKVKLSEVQIFLQQRWPTQPQYVMTSFSSGNIKFLDVVDIVLDRQGQVVGVRLVYTPGDGFQRDVFLRGVRGWLFKRPTLGSLYKEVKVRVVTTDELNNL